MKRRRFKKRRLFPLTLLDENIIIYSFPTWREQNFQK